MLLTRQPTNVDNLIEFNDASAAAKKNSVVMTFRSSTTTLSAKGVKVILTMNLRLAVCCCNGAT